MSETTGTHVASPGHTCAAPAGDGSGLTCDREQGHTGQHRGYNATIDEPLFWPVASVEPPPRIWTLECPFNKRGVPVVGVLGSTVRRVVIIPVETWSKLCEDHPTLKAQRFEVGTYE